jgi:hypothetical protein
LGKQINWNAKVGRAHRSFYDLMTAWFTHFQIVSWLISYWNFVVKVLEFCFDPIITFLKTICYMVQ